MNRAESHTLINNFLISQESQQKFVEAWSKLVVFLQNAYDENGHDDLKDNLVDAKTYLRDVMRMSPDDAYIYVASLASELDDFWAIYDCYPEELVWKIAKDACVEISSLCTTETAEELSSVVEFWTNKVNSV